MFSMPFLALEPVQAEVMIAVTPTRIPLQLHPGETRGARVTLINQGAGEAQLRPRVMLVEEEEEGQLFIEQDERCGWIAYEDERIELMPSEEREFAFSMEVPAGTSPGPHHFALTFEMARDEGEGIGMTGGVAVLVDLEVLPVEGVAGGGFPVAATVALAVIAVITAIALAAAAAAVYRGDERGRA